MGSRNVNRNVDFVTDDRGRLVGYQAGPGQFSGIPTIDSTGALIGADGLPILQQSNPIVLFAAAGSQAAPLGEAIASLTFGKFGLPAPGVIKIPAGTIPVVAGAGFAVIEVVATFKRTGTAAVNNCTLWLGPTNSSSDQTLANPGMDAADGQTAKFTWHVWLGGTTVDSHCEGWKDNVSGTSDITTGGAFNPAVDNFLTIGTNSLNVADTLMLIGLEALLHVNIAGSAGTVSNAAYGVQPETIFVPAEFHCICSQAWPWNGSVVGTAPTFPVGRISNYDNQKTHWNNVHQAANTITWTNIDTWVANSKAAGVRKGVYVLYGTPQFLASSGGTVAAPYGTAASILSGGGAYPAFGDATMSQLIYFCQQFAARNKAVWGGFFDCVSLWNEPDFLQTPGSSSFWWGTKTQFVDTLYAAYSSFKAADPSLMLIGPGTFSVKNANTGLDQWINQVGTLYPTKRGYDCFDVFASHPYHARPLGYSGNGDLQGLQLGGALGIQTVLASTPRAGCPMVCSEYGVSSVADAELTAYLARSTAFRETFVQRLWIDAMLSGFKFMTAFSLGNTANLMGNLSTDDPGAISGLRKVYVGTVGKTIVTKLSGLLPDGSRLLTFTDGTTYKV